MECRTFEITLISATNLEAFTRIFRMKVYARGFHRRTAGAQETDPNRPPRGAEPSMELHDEFQPEEPMVQHYSTMVVVKLFSRRRLACDRYIGEVHTSLKELFDHATSNGGSAILTLPVQKGSVKSQGVIRFSYRFGEKVAIDKLLLAESVAGWSQY